ncbi:MAG: sigma-70 family RNA polymerase sigma factor [Kofleriaceae bacterium]
MRAVEPPRPGEQELLLAWQEGRFDDATTLALERYGPEVLGMLAARLRSDSDAAEAFSMFAVDLWRGLPGFAWRCSLRAWAHRIARNAGHRWRTQARRELPLPSDALERVAARVKTTTLLYLRSEVKSEVRRLRDELSEEDQLVLVLRVDKGLEWRDIAMALADADLEEPELTREAARLRKRLSLATARLRELAQARGLLPSK